MNERIQQLAEQAGFFPTELTQVGPSVEKFAELIVRECGVALTPMFRDMVSRGQAYDLIKQHFGVEE